MVTNVIGAAGSPVDRREAHQLAFVLFDVVSVEHQPTAYSGRLGKVLGSRPLSVLAVGCTCLAGRGLNHIETRKRGRTTKLASCNLDLRRAGSPHTDAQGALVHFADPARYRRPARD